MRKETRLIMEALFRNYKIVQELKGEPVNRDAFQAMPEPRALLALDAAAGDAVGVPVEYDLTGLPPRAKALLMFFIQRARSNTHGVYITDKEARTATGISSKSSLANCLTVLRQWFASKGLKLEAKITRDHGKGFFVLAGLQKYLQ